MSVVDDRDDRGRQTSDRENKLRAARFEKPERIPLSFCISEGYWDHYPQDLVNGIDWIQARLKGRVCIDLDVDRQRVTRFGTPDQIDDHVRHAVEMLGTREGGLMLKHGLFPGIPLENISALMDAMEKYSQHFS